MANVLNYVDYDFDDMVLQLQNRLKSKAAWMDIYRSSTGEMLIELLAYVLNLGMFYTERRAEESYLPTAQLLSSVKNLVSLLNYSPKRKTSSTGNLTFSIAVSSDKIVYIPKYTVCKDAAGLGFLTNEYVAIEKGQTSVDAVTIQGELNRLEVTSNGSANQEYSIANTSVENSATTSNPTLRVIVDGTEWTVVSSFINSLNTDQHYRIIDEMDDTVTIQFGDDVNGAAPESGSILIMQYIASDGLDGNITFTGKITTVSSTIYDEDGTVVDVTVTNSGSFLGGDAAESIEEIRYEAPQVFKTGDRAVNRADFISLLENYAGVANVNVWGENEEAAAAGTSVVANMLNKVKMCIILQEWELPGTTFKATLSDYLYDKSMLTVKYEFVTPVILLVIPVLIVKVTEGHSMSQAQADLESVLATKFVLGDTTKLGTIVKYSEILSVIHDLENIAYVSMDLEIKKVLSSSYDSTYDWSEALDATDVKPETCRVFIDGSYALTDVDSGDGTGTFTAVGITGSINYSTGVIALDIDPAASSVYARYCQDENDNIVPSANQIAKLEDTDIDSISME